MASQYEESALTTLWNFLPGIVKFLSILGLLVSFFVGINLIFAQNDPTAGYSFEEDLVRDYNPRIGKEDSRLVYVYFVDYQCPVCGDNVPVMNQLKEEFKDRILIVYKHNPLPTHSLAPRAGRAVQAAARQNRGLEYGEIVLSRQNEGLTDDNLEAWASVAGIPDIDAFNRDRRSREVENQVEWDQFDLENISLPASSFSDSRTKPPGTGSGTPTSIIMVDGEPVDWIPGRVDYPQIRTKLNELLLPIESNSSQTSESPNPSEEQAETETTQDTGTNQDPASIEPTNQSE